MYLVNRNICFVILFNLLTFGCVSKSNNSVSLDSGDLRGACNQALATTAVELDEESIKTLKSTKKEDLVQFHFSWGMGIRNGFLLWEKEFSIRVSFAKSVGLKDMHPDDASGVIMNGVWELLNEKNI